MPRILYITHALPFPPNVGGNQRTAILQRALSKHGEMDLIVVCRYGPLPRELLEEGQRDHGVLEAVTLPWRGTLPPWNLVRRLAPRKVDRLAQAFGSQVMWYRPYPELSGVVEKALSAKHYDLIVSRHLYPAAMAGILQKPTGIPVIIDVDDVDHRVAEENGHPSVPWYKRMAFVRQAREIRHAALPLFPKASHLWVAASEDAEEFDPNRCSILPNIPYLKDEAPRVPCPPARDSVSILLVASMGYAPNSEGLEYLLKRVWPTIRKAVGNATLRIVGSGMGDERQARWSAIPGVTALGFAPDLREEYQRAAFCVVPVHRGGGTKIKAIECFTFGRTCVVTTHSYRGIGDVLKHRKSLWRGDTDDQFAEGCIHLLTHPDERDAMAETGRLLVEREFNFAKFQSVVDKTIEKVGLGAGK